MPHVEQIPMKIICRRLFFAITFLAIASWNVCLNAQTLKAGAALSNITPPIGQEIIGGFSPAPSTNVHDELHARCLVLDDGKAKLAIVVVDLVGISHLV